MRLNLGAGAFDIEGYESIDYDQADLSQFPWPWASDSVKSIVASHILEHFTKQQGYEFLRESYRLLEPAGTLFIAVPDMDKFITARLTGDNTPLGGYTLTDLNCLCGGCHETGLQKHRYLYCFESLAFMLDRVGFSHAWKREYWENVDNPAYRGMSLYMEAIK